MIKRTWHSQMCNDVLLDRRRNVVNHFEWPTASNLFMEFVTQLWVNAYKTGVIDWNCKSHSAVSTSPQCQLVSMTPRNVPSGRTADSFRDAPCRMTQCAIVHPSRLWSMRLSALRSTEARRGLTVHSSWLGWKGVRVIGGIRVIGGVAVRKR